MRQMYKFNNEAVPMAAEADDVYESNAAMRNVRIAERLKRGGSLKFLSIDNLAELLGDIPTSTEWPIFSHLVAEMMTGKLKPDCRLKNGWLINITNRSMHNAKVPRQAFSRDTLREYFGNEPTPSELLNKWLTSDYEEPFQPTKIDTVRIIENERRAQYAIEAVARMKKSGEKKAPAKNDIYDRCRAMCTPADRSLFSIDNEALDTIFWQSPQRRAALP